MRFEPSPLHTLPTGLRALAGRVSFLARDLRWTWSHAGDELWKHIDPQLWEQTGNPHVMLQSLTRERLAALDADAPFKARLQQLAEAHAEYCRQPGWYGETYPQAELKRVAYFSMEFGLGEALPLYAGGLGILAGDYLKAASDLGVPVVGVGLLYQEGYFRQTVDHDGRQLEFYPYNDPTSIPIAPVQSASGAWLQVSLQLPGRPVHFRVWQARVGRVDLYLLDSNAPLNSPSDRGITSKLYGDGGETRLLQEIALGIGGWRVLEALGLEIDVCHLNEGHAALVGLERARSFMERHQVDFQTALWATRAGNVFTTHTPVAAGFDRFDPALLLKYGRQYAERLGIDPQALVALARSAAAAVSEPFNMAYLAMRTCSTVNGVSRLHGEVSRALFQVLYPRWPRGEVPVTHVTNGVHVPSWDSPWADEAWTRAAGKERWRTGGEGLAEAILQNVSDEALWAFRGRERADLVGYARRRLALHLGQRGEDPETVAQADKVLDPNAFTLGFARRFAEYKRPDLLLRDPQRLLRLLTRPGRPVQLIVAGKAHPRDERGKQFVQTWMAFVRRPEVRARVVFLEDYDIALAQELVQGVDVWLNTPRRPWEACGTSGMKVLVNGGLNLSELDGWWAEAYAPEVGWALGDGREHADPQVWDAREAEQLYRLLEDEVVPLFYARDPDGIPRDWVRRMRASMARLTPQFSATRMLREYIKRFYLPAARAVRARGAQDGRLGRELCEWDGRLYRHWQNVHLANLVVHEGPDSRRFELQVYLGEIATAAVQVQLYADAAGDGAPLCIVMQRGEGIPGTSNGYLYSATTDLQRPYTDFTPRIVPFHPDAHIPVENHLITWWSGRAQVSRGAATR